MPKQNNAQYIPLFWIIHKSTFFQAVMQSGSGKQHEAKLGEAQPISVEERQQPGPSFRQTERWWCERKHRNPEAC